MKLWRQNEDRRGVDVVKHAKMSSCRCRWVPVVLKSTKSIHRTCDALFQNYLFKKISEKSMDYPWWVLLEDMLEFV